VPRTHHVINMAGFGTATPGSKKGKKGTKSAAAPKGISAKKQWDRYTKLRQAGAEAVQVFARDGTGSEDWSLVGSVAVDSADASVAAYFQKRLILEHAVRMYPKLRVAGKTLEVGCENSGGEIALVNKCEAPPDLSCGFVGEPDPGGFYQKGNRIQKQNSGGGAAPASDSKGRIG